MADLKTDYVNDVLDTDVNTERTYNIVDANGNIVYEGVKIRETTVLDTTGDNFGAQDINNTNSHLVADDGSGNTLDFQFATDGTDYGYLDGNGDFTPFRTRHTETFSPTSRANNLDMGLYHKKRYVDTTAVPNINSETYTFPRDNGDLRDLGETNNYRYVNATAVRSKGWDEGYATGKAQANVNLQCIGYEVNSHQFNHSWSFTTNQAYKALIVVSIADTGSNDPDSYINIYGINGLLADWGPARVDGYSYTHRIGYALNVGAGHTITVQSQFRTWNWVFGITTS